MMRRYPCWNVLALVCSSLLLGGPGMAQQAANPLASHRSPVDLVVDPTDTWAVTANQTSGTLSLVSDLIPEESQREH